MNKTRRETAEYARRVGDYLTANSLPIDTQLFIIPSFLSLESALPLKENSAVRLGVQNIYPGDEGAFTGEVSARQAADAGASIALIGHSERRALFGETDEGVNAKVLAAIDTGLTALICVGERAIEREAGCGKEHVVRQVRMALIDVPKEATPLIWIAYEPVWAIGVGGRPATSAYAEEVHTAIRSALTELYDTETARQIPILYGGSVDMENAAEYVRRSNIDGVFVGRYALDVDAFIRLIDSLKKLRAEAGSI